MLTNYVVVGIILVVIGFVFIDKGMGGRTIAKLIPFGPLEKLFRQFIISLPTGAVFIFAGAYLLLQGL